MSSPPRVSEFLNALSSIEFNYNLQLSSAAAALYNHVLTINQEVELIWKQKWTFAKVLYILIRYIGSTSVILNVIAFTSDIESSMFCDVFLKIQFVSGLLIIFIMQIILQLRLYAIYRMSWKIAIFTATCFVAEIVITLVISAQTYFSRTVEVSFSVSPDIHVCTLSSVSAPGYVLWISILLFEAVLCGLAVWVVIRNRMRGQDNSRLLHVILRDSILYFISIFVFYTIEMVLWSTLNSTAYISDSFAFNATVVMGSHSILSLRGAYWRPLNHGDTPSSIDANTMGQLTFKNGLRESKEQAAPPRRFLQDGHSSPSYEVHF